MTTSVMITAPVTVFKVYVHGLNSRLNVHCSEFAKGLKAPEDRPRGTGSIILTEVQPVPGR